MLEWTPLWDAMKAEYESGRNAWTPTTENMHNEMLGVVPPRAGGYSRFLVGESWKDNDDYVPVYACFRQVGDRFEARYMTLAEFKAGK